MGPQGEHIVITCLRSYYLCLYSLFSSPDPYLLSFTPRHEYYTMFLGLIRRDCLLLMLRRLCKTCVFRVSQAWTISNNDLPPRSLWARGVIYVFLLKDV